MEGGGDKKNRSDPLEDSLVLTSSLASAGELPSSWRKRKERDGGSMGLTEALADP